MIGTPDHEPESHLDGWLTAQLTTLHDALDSVLDIDAGLDDVRMSTQLRGSLDSALDKVLDVEAGLHAALPHYGSPHPRAAPVVSDESSTVPRPAAPKAVIAATRWTPMVQLMAGIALIMVFIVGVLVAGSPTSASHDTRPRPASSVSVAAKLPGAEVFHVTRTLGNGLNMRSCAGVGCALVGWIADGGTFTATCSVIGTPINGDRTWLRGVAGGRSGYVSHSYLDPMTTMPACGATRGVA
jgi:hypothetical protein